LEGSADVLCAPPVPPEEQPPGLVCRLPFLSAEVSEAPSPHVDMAVTFFFRRLSSATPFRELPRSGITFPRCDEFLSAVVSCRLSPVFTHRPLFRISRRFSREDPPSPLSSSTRDVFPLWTVFYAPGLIQTVGRSRFWRALICFPKLVEEAFYGADHGNSSC